MVRLRRAIPDPVPGRAASGESGGRVGRYSGPDPRPMLTMLLTPAMHHRLMSGRPTDARLLGWARLERQEHTPEAVWKVYGHRLMSEATAAGFLPWMASGVPPTGEAFDGRGFREVGSGIHRAVSLLT
jgi:hypothetical protein